MALDTRMDLSLIANLTKTAVAGMYPHDPLNLARTTIYATGTGAGQADTLYYAERTLAASATEDLDLTGTLTNNLGQSVVLARIKALLVSASVGNTNNVVVGAAGSNQWATLLNSTGTVTIRPGAFFMAMAGQTDATGWTITASTGDLLKVANSSSGSSVTYQIYVIGCSA